MNSQRTQRAADRGAIHARNAPAPAPPKQPMRQPRPVQHPARYREHEVLRLIRDLTELAATRMSKIS